MSLKTHRDGYGSLQLAEAELRIETTGGESFVATGSDPQGGVLQVSIEQHANDQIDQGSIELLNDDGRYGSDQRISRGDRVEWWVRLRGGSELTERWTGLVEDVEFIREGPKQRVVTLEADDYVFGVLSDRIVYRAFIDEPIVEIIDTLIASKAPELNVELPSSDDLDETATIVSNGENLLEIVESLAQRANSLLVGEGTTLKLMPIGSMTTALQLSETNVDAAIGGEYRYREQPDDLMTFLRIDGGDAAAEDDVQEDQDGFETVTETDRLTTRISPTRSKLDRVELIPRELSDEELVVRIQRNDDGAPAAVDDRNADIARREVAPDDPRWVDEDWSQWLLQEHISHDQDPWLIIQTNGDQGHEIAVNSEGDPTYRTFYAYPVIAESANPSAEDRYGRIERSISDNSIRSFLSAQEETQAQLAKNERPREIFQFEAASPSTFDLQFSDLVELNFPKDGAIGRFVVADRTDRWGQSLDLRSNFVLQSVRSL